MPKFSFRGKLVVFWLLSAVLLLSTSNSNIIAYAENITEAGILGEAQGSLSEENRHDENRFESNISELLDEVRSKLWAEAAALASAKAEAAKEAAAAEEIEEAETEETAEKQATSSETKAQSQTETTVSSQAAQPKTNPVGEEEKEQEPEIPPVSYKWGTARTIHFRTEVKITNKSSEEISEDIRVLLPMLENYSPYQKTNLTATNYPVLSTQGRTSTFNIGALQPGESKKVVVDYSITLRPVAINSTNDIVKKARQAYDQYAGSGNCSELVTAFLSRCRDLGVKARRVNGFTRPQRANITAGSLQGCRHSWAEFYIEGLGWVPVDLTFEYFGKLPYSSHIVETYADLPINVKYNGGELSATWSNMVM